MKELKTGEWGVNIWLCDIGNLRFLCTQRFQKEINTLYERAFGILLLGSRDAWLSVMARFSAARWKCQRLTHTGCCRMWVMYGCKLLVYGSDCYGSANVCASAVLVMLTYALFSLCLFKHCSSMLAQSFAELICFIADFSALVVTVINYASVNQ